MKTAIKKTVKQVKQAIPAKKVVLNHNEAMVIHVEDADKSFIKMLAKKHLIAKRREDELKVLKKQFLEEIVPKYVSDKDKETIVGFDENKYIEFIADSDSVRDNVQYNNEYDNNMLLKLADKRDVLKEVATVSIAKIRPFLREGEEEAAIVSEKIIDKVTVTKK